MSLAAHDTLIRKQFLISREQARKLEAIARRRGGSAAEVVRAAIDAFDPDAVDDLAMPELMELVAGQLKEAIESTERANRRVEDALSRLQARR